MWLFRVLAVTLAISACEGKPAPVTPTPGSGSAAAVGESVPWWITPDGGVAVDPLPLPDEDQQKALAEAACPSAPHPYFYKIEKDGKTSFILGTRHLGVGLDKLPPVVRDTVTHASLAVFEVAPDDHSTAPASAPPGPLSTLLTQVEWQHFRAIVGDDLGDKLEDLPPAIADISLELLFEDRTHQLDTELQTAAAEAHVPTQGLETSAFQDELIDKVLGTKHLRSTLVIVQSRADLAKLSKDDLASFCKGDRTDLDPKDRADLLRSGYSAAEADEYFEQLVFSRNRDWIPKLETILAPGNAFVAVGADHLQGAKGVPALLRAKGYTVTRVTPP